MSKQTIRVKIGGVRVVLTAACQAEAADVLDSIEDHLKFQASGKAHIIFSLEEIITIQVEAYQELGYDHLTVEVVR